MLNEELIDKKDLVIAKLKLKINKRIKWWDREIKKKIKRNGAIL